MDVGGTRPPNVHFDSPYSCCTRTATANLQGRNLPETYGWPGPTLLTFQNRKVAGRDVTHRYVPGVTVEAPMRIHRRKDADPAAGLKKYGDTEFADAVNKKYPIDTPGRIKAAWAYIHQPSNAGKYTATEARTIRSRIRKAAKARKVELPDPDEFVELMARVRRRKK